MTTENQIAKAKKVPTFVIYERNAEGKLTRAGAAFAHGKGAGFNILVGDKVYTAFPPSLNSAPEKSA